MQRATALPALALFMAVPAQAQGPASHVDMLERELAVQRDRIARLEALVEKQSAALERLTATSQIATAPVAQPPVAPSPAATASFARPSGDAFRLPGLDVAGDVRVREEFNVSDADTRTRTRSVLRARLRATYQIDKHFSVGGQLTTGDPDDPNSTDVTLTGFNDDLDISLDQAWIRYKAGGLTAYAGKFLNIFQRTDMVWDGDVSPEGVGVSYSLPIGHATLDARAIYFIVDEAPSGPDSAMIGVQGVVQTPIGNDFKLLFAGAYYDYRLRSLAGGDTGDFRSNLIVGGRYLSDFRLVNGLAALTWTGLGSRWPLMLTADAVHNRGARTASDSGFNIEFSAGKAAHEGDWRLFYNYSQVGVDAVFAAFSHDNIGIATNYELHGLAVDYVPAENILLNATLYHYRPLRSFYAGANQPDDWLNRIRLNMMLSF
ncbi:hypothetical protein WP12_03180 [Sphingomonas sp. SRS2]|nr:hypothetical protein WP12_03180 [Sphingomonas sp. SRS2]